MEKKARPIIKWAGGKRQLLPELTKRMPKHYGRYFEPFFGSGALFFDLSPNKAVINDFNPELVNLYNSVRDHLDELKGLLIDLQTQYNSLGTQEARAAFYYKKRDEYNETINNVVHTVNDAALLLFLNKACYNGLYRVNSQGLYNTPFSKKDKINLFDDDNLFLCSNDLKKATILTGDFEVACKGIRKGDFVYFDSPYYDTFDTYQAGGFPESEHKRLADLFYRLSERGVYCMLSNSDTDFIKGLYSNYNIDVIPVKRMINCDGKKRTGTEVIVINYEV